METSLAAVERDEVARRPALALLAARVEAACEGPVGDFAGRIREALAAAAADAADLLHPGQRQGQALHYTRHLLHADVGGRFAIVSIVWHRGHRTPVHGHYTWCGYSVVEGSLHEESYLWSPGATTVHRNGSAERRAGYTCFGHAGVEAIHRLGNRLQAPAISVHVYGVDAPRVATHVNRVLAAAD